jgi:hypothetical protein
MQSVISGEEYLFTAEKYLELDVPENTELLGGRIYHVSPRNEPHRHAVNALTRTLAPCHPEPVEGRTPVQLR